MAYVINCFFSDYKASIKYEHMSILKNSNMICKLTNNKEIWEFCMRFITEKNEREGRIHSVVFNGCTCGWWMTSLRRGLRMNQPALSFGNFPSGGWRWIPVGVDSQPVKDYPSRRDLYKCPLSWWLQQVYQVNCSIKILCCKVFFLFQLFISRLLCFAKLACD